MKIPEEIAKRYRLPAELTEFQISMYIHLIEWKWKYITKEPGRNGAHFYDAILPDEYKNKLFPLYRPIVKDVNENHQFKIHKHFGHMASSQAACINLFAPLLKRPEIANAILPKINPYFNKIATEELEGGFQFEYWDESNPLNDHTGAAGTDSDIAIAYYNKHNNLSLWLIEHKLTESEFTTCGGYRSKGNKKKKNCLSAPAVLKDHSLCYYQYQCGYKYWQITKTSKLYDTNVLLGKSRCPFIDGTNQLWRNQLMGHEIIKKKKFKHVHFSVVHHPENPDLSDTIERYSKMLLDKSIFSSFSSKDIIDAVRVLDDKEIKNWGKWYTELYKIA